MNDVPVANRIHIGFFGKRNAGKSSVVNAVTGQNISVVSDILGTTTDPVKKTMELLPLGPVLIIDTPGFDDEGSLGEQRIKKTKQILNMTDIAVLVVDATVGVTNVDRELISIFETKKIPYLLVYNKCDLISVDMMKQLAKNGNFVLVSAKDKHNIDQLKEKIGLILEKGEERTLLGDIVSKGDVVLLVTPIDSAAPKARMIMPQQMTIRALLDENAICIVVRESELEKTINELVKKPKLIITDSQALGLIKKLVPEETMITTFSILMARYKGFLDSAVNGAIAVSNLEDGDFVLICEGCTHHRQCDDIGTVKIPKWLEAYTGKKLKYTFTSGGEYPEDLSGYKMIIHCGGCMLNEKEISYRRKSADDQGIPFTNYGIVIAMINDMLTKCLKPFDK